MTKLILVLAATALLVLLTTDVINAMSSSTMPPMMTGTTYSRSGDVTSQHTVYSGSASVQTSFIMSLLVPVALAALWSKFF